jgi:hypothetical protein
MSRSDRIEVVPGSLGAIKQALNASGWIDGEVIAAGELRQGKPTTLAGVLTGAAIVGALRPRRSKALPGHFVLAATADRIVAFKASGGGGGDDADSMPYFVKIEPGARGSWPRASVRVFDLPDGGRSKGGMLALDGTERLPVARAGLDRDPDTDELLDLLSSGAPAVHREVPAEERRYREDQADLRRASAIRTADFRELAADAVRGRPETDLAGWAERRGLGFRGSTGQGGHLSVTCPWSEDLLFNVVRGRWPGGTEGVVCHEARIYGESARGFFHPAAWSTAGAKRGSALVAAVDVVADLSGHPLPLLTGSSGESYFKVPYTSAGSRVPHLATVTGLHVARRAERHTPPDKLFGTWQSRALDDLGLRDRWIAGVRKHSDEATVERLLRGPIRELLSVQQGLGFEIRIEYGQVIASRQDFVKRDDDLDALVAAAESLARAVREICVPAAGAPALATPLPPPQWLAAVRRRPTKKHTLWPVGALLERVVQLADERGMAVEDPRAFHNAFPGLNVPGEAFGVLNGRLPGTTLTGRLLCCAERPMVLPDAFREFLTDPGGAAGSDVAVVAVRPDAPSTPPEGELDGDLRVAVADGVLTAWRLRPSWQANGPALDRLAADVAAVVRQRGRD